MEPVFEQFYYYFFFFIHKIFSAFIKNYLKFFFPEDLQETKKCHTYFDSTHSCDDKNNWE
jgi:hypothetical protein